MKIAVKGGMEIVRGLILGLCFWMGLSAAAEGPVTLKAKTFSCEAVVSKSKATKVYRSFFTTEIRGQIYEIPYMMNRKRLVKSKDVILVLPGLSKGAFEEKLLALGQMGEQAISLDLININGVGPFQAPTPEEDAQLVHDLLIHLGLEKENFGENLYVVNHSRGSIVTTRLVSAFYQEFSFAGVVMFNPYMGWIPNFFAKNYGKFLGSGWRVYEAMNWFNPYVRQAAGMTAAMVEAAGSQISRATLDFFSNIHNPRQMYQAFKKSLKIDDEEFLEGLRQKLIGMEDSEITEDLELMGELKIPILIVRSDNDELVPAAQVDSMAKRFHIPVLVFKDSDHFLPYKKTDATTAVVVKALANLRNKKSIATGIR